MKTIPVALVVFEPPSDADSHEVARLGIEIESWHLGTLPLLIDLAHFIPLSPKQMRLLRRHLDEGRDPEATALALSELGSTPVHDFRAHWALADDWHFGTVHLLFLIPPDMPIEELQRVLDRNEIRLFSRRTP